MKLSDFGTRIKAKTLSSNMSAIRRLHHKFRNLFLIEQECISKSSFRASEMSVGISLVVIKIKSGRLPRLVPSLAMTSFLIEQKMAVDLIFKGE